MFIVADCVYPKEPKNGNSKKNCTTQDILMVGGLSWGDIGAMLAYLEDNTGPCLGYLGAMLVHLGGYVGPS